MLKWLAAVLVIFILSAQKNLKAAVHFYPTGNLSLQDVIVKAEEGDTVIVAPGTYNFYFENLLIVNEFLVLKSSGGAEVTTLRGTGRGSVVSFAAGSKAVLDGFTIVSDEAHRRLDLHGGGIYCAPESAPVIINNRIEGNQAVFGGGIYCGNLSAPRIEGNRIYGNKAYNSGGGIFSMRSYATIINNRLHDNEAGSSGGGISGNRDNVVVSNNIIWKNSAPIGGGLSYARSSSIVANNTITGNMANSGGGIFVDKGSLRLTNIILWKNKNEDLFFKQIGPSARPVNSLIGDGSFRGMNGNLARDPMFVDLENGDFHLLPESPCINAGSDDPFYDDVDGSVNDMGAYGGPGVKGY